MSIDTLPRSLSTIPASTSGHYLTRWHYRTRCIRGYIARYEEKQTETFSIEVDAASPTQAYETALPLAEARYREDSNRVEDTLDFDTMVAATANEIREAGSAVRKKVLIAKIAICLALLGVFTWAQHVLDPVFHPRF